MQVKIANFRYNTSLHLRHFTMLSTEQQSALLLQSLLNSPLLLSDLPEASVFDRNKLILPATATTFNFQQKLGHLYEDALEILLHASPHIELLEKSLQIQKDKHSTVGEIDFLVRESCSDQLTHLELAIKFYLAVKSDDELLLPGPDARDNYYRKLQRMREHQLTLPHRYQNQLPEVYRDAKIITKQLVCGCIFHHIDDGAPPAIDFISPTSRREKWLHAKEVKNYFGGDSQLYIIPKKFWPVLPKHLPTEYLEPWHNDQITTKCVMVKSNSSDEAYFIAPDNYPKAVG